MPHLQALGSGQALFHGDSIELAIVRNDGWDCPFSFGSPNPSLESVHNVFEPVIDIMKRQFTLIHVHEYV